MELFIYKNYNDFFLNIAKMKIHFIQIYCFGLEIWRLKGDQLSHFLLIKTNKSKIILNFNI